MSHLAIFFQWLATIFGTRSIVNDESTIWTPPDEFLNRLRVEQPHQLIYCKRMCKSFESYYYFEFVTRSPPLSYTTSIAEQEMDANWKRLIHASSRPITSIRNRKLQEITSPTSVLL